MQSFVDFAYKVIKLLLGDPATRWARSMILAGICLLATPWWFPIVVAVAANVGGLSEDQILRAQSPMTITGWVFIVVGVSWIALDRFVPRPTETANSVEPTHPADLDLYREFQELFSGELIRFFRDHNFLQSFNPRHMKTLFDYTETWTTAKSEFVDDELQAQHAQFFQAAGELAAGLSLKTHQNRMGLATVAPTQHQGGPLPEWAAQDGKDLNQLSQAFVESHELMLRVMRKRLGC